MSTDLASTKELAPDAKLLKYALPVTSAGRAAFHEARAARNLRRLLQEAIVARHGRRPTIGEEILIHDAAEASLLMAYHGRANLANGKSIDSSAIILRCIEARAAALHKLGLEPQIASQASLYDG